MRYKVLLILILLIVLCPGTVQHPAAAQNDTPCGIVDAIDYPIDGISIDFDDFGMYRAGFNGRHTGIDLAFGRYGEPVRAAARGRVTYSDVNGWDTEKGVVIIEHFFPGNQIYYTLYGHMEENDGIKFPRNGQCVQKGDIIGTVGHPSRGAPHLHYETRTMSGVTGGPGYYPTDPLDAGWLHPIDFTEGWKLRLTSAFRSMVTAGGGMVAPPIWHSDGRVTFAEQYHLEELDSSGVRLWRLDVQGLVGMVTLPDGRILGRTIDDNIIIFDGARFAVTWKADRPLRSAPIRLGDSIVFVSQDNRMVSYNLDGSLHWQTDPLGDYIGSYVAVGDHLALSVNQGDTYKVLVIDSSGTVTYKATAPAPVSVIAGNGGFYLTVATQLNWLSADMHLSLLMDTSQPFGRDSQVTFDPAKNAIVYPGQGNKIYAYNANGSLRWTATLPVIQHEPPLLGIGSGCLAYVLTDDGTLFAYRMSDGALRGLTTLYAGGSQGHNAARFLNVSPKDQVQFSAGYLSIATIDGPTLATMQCS